MKQTLDFKEMQAILNKGFGQEAIDHMAEIDKLLPSLSPKAKHDIGRLVLRLEPSVRIEFLDALKGDLK